MAIRIVKRVLKYRRWCSIETRLSVALSIIWLGSLTKQFCTRGKYL
uniref:Uncharacterized protein n=1 Tax=Arundo donax TaxID=35708 RepID=A0A0A9GPU5_ARUDO